MTEIQRIGGTITGGYVLQRGFRLGTKTGAIHITSRYYSNRLLWYNYSIL